MKKYYRSQNMDPFLYLPLTFHVGSVDDEEWNKFIDCFKKSQGQ